MDPGLPENWKKTGLASSSNITVFKIIMKYNKI